MHLNAHSCLSFDVSCPVCHIACCHQDALQLTTDSSKHEPRLSKYRHLNAHTLHLNARILHLNAPQRSTPLGYTACVQCHLAEGLSATELMYAVSLTLSTYLAWPLCLVCRSCCVLFLQGLLHSSQTMLRTYNTQTFNDTYQMFPDARTHVHA